MELLVMRHGSAEESTDDFNRRLTQQGRDEVLAASRLISRHHYRPEVIYSSPLLRARQTAGIVAEQFSLDVVECDSIVPEGDCREVCEWLGQQGSGKILIVSHQPFVSLFVRYLTGEQRYMDTASLSMIHLDEGTWQRGRLEWVE